MRKIIFILLLCAPLLCDKQQAPQSAPVEYFKNGQILLLDYAIPDTLVVMDAAGLNKAIAPIEQGYTDFESDKDIADLFYKYCIVK